MRPICSISDFVAYIDAPDGAVRLLSTDATSGSTAVELSRPTATNRPIHFW